MRFITDQNGTKWTVSIYGSRYSVGVDDIIIGSMMTLLFESEGGKTRNRTTGERPLGAISDGELLALLNNVDNDI